jgi:nucleotide-binding universal stress UspA family protein
MLSRILVPLDGDPITTDILPSLRALVGGTGAEVHLLAVRPPLRELAQSEERHLYLDELLREESAVWQDYLARQGSQLAYDGVVVRREVRFGDPLAETLAAAERHAVHLIALAARPQQAVQRALRPNLAQQLLAQSAVPVLAVPAWPPPERGTVLHYHSVPV